MMKLLTEVLGLLGAMAVAVGYLPQIHHLAREHCSAGVSIVAWKIWLLSSLLVLTHAFELSDFVFIALQAVNIVAIVSIISLARRYRDMTCAFHRQVAGRFAGGLPTAARKKGGLVNAAR